MENDLCGTIHAFLDFYTYILYFIWCLIHRASTTLQINLQFYNFLTLRVNYVLCNFIAVMLSVTQHYYWGSGGGVNSSKNIFFCQHFHNWDFEFFI